MKGRAHSHNSDRVQPAPRWSTWQPLPFPWRPSPAVLAETLDGGQAFRWHQADGLWTGLWSDHLVQLRLTGKGTPAWRAPAILAPAASAALPAYFGADRDWPALTDSLPWRSDVHLARCLEAFPGLRILRQPFGETLLGFLCSATKQIVQIKQMVALLASRHGQSLRPGGHVIPNEERDPLRNEKSRPASCPSSPAFSPHPSSFSSLPSWSALASLSETELRACQLGFRARFIHQTAQFLANSPGWLETTEALPYADAKLRLMELPGVGEKVADCVLLFGAGKLEAFPVDTWVLKSLARRYGLVGWKPAQVAQFGRAHFGPLAGLAQQFLFAWERRFSRPANT